MSQQDCVFCKIIAGNIPSKIITQTDSFIVLQDIAPQAPIHYLIVPKKHVTDLSSCRDEDRDLLADMMLATSKLSSQLDDPKSFKLITNNGHAAGQRVFHLHFHFLAGKTFEA